MLRRRSPSSSNWLAYCMLNGRRVSLGRWGPEAQAKFDKLLAEWLANGRRLESEVNEGGDLLVVDDLCDRFVQHLQLKHDQAWQANNLTRIKLSHRALRERFGRMDANALSPTKLEEVRHDLIGGGRLCRGEINRRIRDIKRTIRWACSREMLDPKVWMACNSLEGLRAGDYDTRDSKQRQAVPREDVWAVLPRVSTPVAAIIQVLYWSGARPGEILNLRPRDIDRSGKVWVATPATHKNAHRGRDRQLYFGGNAQEVLRPFLDCTPRPNPMKPIFRPGDADHDRRRRGAEDPSRLTAIELAARLGVCHETPRLWARRGCPRNADGTYDYVAVRQWRDNDPKALSSKTRIGQRFEKKRVQDPKRGARDAYDSHSLRRAVSRAIKSINAERKKAKQPEMDNWTPYALRHSCASRLAAEFGPLVAQTVLGHSDLATTGVYVHGDRERAKSVMESAG